MIKQHQHRTGERERDNRRMESEPVLHQQLSSQYRALQPQAAQAIQHGQPHLGHHTLASQAGLDLDLNNSDAVFHQELRLQDPNGHGFQSSNPFEQHGHGHGPMHVQNNGSPHTPQHNNGGQFGILAAGSIQHNSIARLQEDDNIYGAPDGSDQKSNGHLSTKVVVDPPNLAEWRQKLFNVDEMITLSEDEYVAETLCYVYMFTKNAPTGFKLTFLMSIMYTPTVPPNATSASPSFPITGTADLKEDPLEHPNRTIPIRRSGSERQESGTYAMSRSRSQNTSQVLCYGRILYQTEAQFHSQIQHRVTTSLRPVNQEPLFINKISLVSLLSTVLWEQITPAQLDKDTTPSSGSTVMVETVKAMASRDLTSMPCQRVTGSRRIVSRDSL